MPDPQDRVEHEPDPEAGPPPTPAPEPEAVQGPPAAEPRLAAEPAPAKKPPAKKAAKKAPAKKGADKAAAKKVAKKTPPKKAPAKAALAAVPTPVETNGSRPTTGAKEAAAHAKSAIDTARLPVGPPESDRSAVALLLASTLGLLTLLVLRQLLRRAAAR